MRLGSVARLADCPVEVFLEDPPNSDASRRYVIDPDRLILAYYQPVRDLTDVYGPRWRGVSGPHGFEAAPIGDGRLYLGAHRLIREALDDPAGLREARRRLADEISLEQDDAVEADDRELSLPGQPQRLGRARGSVWPPPARMPQRFP